MNKDELLNKKLVDVTVEEFIEAFTYMTYEKKIKYTIENIKMKENLTAMVLRFIEDNPNTTVYEIAKKMGATKQSITAIVNRLEKEHIIERWEDMTVTGAKKYPLRMRQINE